MNDIQNSNTIKYFINKLVRDSIESVMDKEISLTLKKATQIKYNIIRKLLEEIQELSKEIFNNPSQKYSIISELADIFEVMLKIIQIWHTDYKFYTLNDIMSVVLQYDTPIEETKPLLIVRKMYKLAIDLLKMNNESNAIRIQNINLLCNCFTVLLAKLDIKFYMLIAVRIGKQKNRGIFNNNLILVSIEMPKNHRLMPYYDAKYKIIK